MSTAVLKTPLIAGVQLALVPLGYRRVGAVFMRARADVVHLIEIQGASSNAAGHASFTVNVGVYAHGLDEPGQRGAGMPSMPAAHWRERIGFLTPTHADIWWTVSSKAEAETAADDMAANIARYAVPMLKQLDNRVALLALWHTGVSPGLMASQRQAHLERLGACA